MFLFIYLFIHFSFFINGHALWFLSFFYNYSCRRIDFLIDFNGMSTHLELFHAYRLVWRQID